MSNPVVSVVIPTYNQEQYIAQSIQSSLDQRVTFNFEVLVGDDCSTDNTADIVRGFSARFPGIIKGFYSEKNEGLVKNIKRLFDASLGKYLVLLGGDDLCSSTQRLCKEVDFLEHNTDFGVVHSDADGLVCDEQGKSNLIKNLHVWKNDVVPTGEVFEALLSKYFIYASTACLRADLYRKYIDYDNFISKGFVMEDLPMWLELSRRTKFGYIPESLAVYRILQNSISRPKNPKQVYDFWENGFKVKFYFIEKYGCSYEVKKNVDERYWKDKLYLSFLLRDNAEAEAAWQGLAQLKCKISFKQEVYYFLTKGIFIWLFSKRFINFLKRIKVRTYNSNNLIIDSNK